MQVGHRGSLGGGMRAWELPPEGKEASMFFFEKKNQKTFPRWHACQTTSKGEKSFCFFFFRKRRILAY
jgi:hypothetical protein